MTSRRISMKINLALIFLTASLSVFSQEKQLSGTWLLTSMRLDNTLINSDLPTEGPYRWIYPNTHWLFTNKKAYEIDYPCCLLEIYDYVVTKEGDHYLMSWSEGKLEAIYSIQLRNDSLIMEEKRLLGAVYYFVKDTIAGNELTKYTDSYINPVCLYGDWEIPIGEVSVAFDAINMWYPWKLPEKIHIDEKNLHQYWSNNRLYLEVDGVKRPFRVKKVSLQNENMTLIPESWVEEYIEKNKFDEYEYQVESVWLRKLE